MVNSFNKLLTIITMIEYTYTAPMLYVMLLCWKILLYLEIRVLYELIYPI